MSEWVIVSGVILSHLRALRACCFFLQFAKVGQNNMGLVSCMVVVISIMWTVSERANTNLMTWKLTLLPVNCWMKMKSPFRYIAIVKEILSPLHHLILEILSSLSPPFSALYELLSKVHFHLYCFVLHSAHFLDCCAFFICNTML